VDVCPEKDTLYLSAINNWFNFSPKFYALILVLLFILGTSLAHVLGVWQNNITNKEYLYHIKRINEPVYQHNRGDVPNYQENRTDS
jgi:hypothetical protein